MSPSSKDVADASKQPHSLARQLDKKATIGGRCDCLARFARFTKRATPWPCSSCNMHAGVLKVMPHPYDLAARNRFENSDHFDAP